MDRDHMSSETPMSKLNKWDWQDVCGTGELNNRNHKA